MPIPPGIEPGLVWCLVWLALNVAILAVIHELASIEHLKERVRVRTYRRLLDLNEYLGRLDDNWRRNPTKEDLVPDLDALRALKRVVDRAAWIDRLLVLRAQLIEVARLVALLELFLALLAAVVVVATPDDNALVGPGALVFGTGFVISLACLVLVGLLGVRITAGSDYE